MEEDFRDEIVAFFVSEILEFQYGRTSDTSERELRTVGDVEESCRSRVDSDDVTGHEFSCERCGTESIGDTGTHFHCPGPRDDLGRHLELEWIVWEELSTILYDEIGGMI